MTKQKKTGSKSKPRFKKALIFLAMMPVAAWALYTFAHPKTVNAAIKSDEQTLISLINAERSKYGVSALTSSECMSKGARQHSYKMATEGYAHSNSFAGEVIKNGCGVALTYAENIATGWSASGAFASLVASPCHYANIVSRTFTASPCNVTGSYGSLPYTHVGVGTYRNASGLMFVTQVFINCPGCTTLEVSVPGDPAPADASGASSGSGGSAAQPKKTTPSIKPPATRPTPTPPTPTPTPSPIPPAPIDNTTVLINNAAPDAQKNLMLSPNASITISGRAIANAKINLYIFSEPRTAATVADSQGLWSISIPGLEPGDHRVEAEVVDPSTGLVSKRTLIASFAASAPQKSPVERNTLPSKLSLFISSQFFMILATIFLGLVIGLGYSIWRRQRHSYKKNLRNHSG